MGSEGRDSEEKGAVMGGSYGKKSFCEFRIYWLGLNLSVSEYMSGLIARAVVASKGFCLFSLLACVSLLQVSSVQAEERLWVEGDGAPPVLNLTLPSFAPVVEKLGASVVNISIEGTEGGAAPQRGGNRFGGGSPFDLFQFPEPPQGRRSFQSLGSGFVLNKEGYIVTNNHVVEKATKILVTFRNDKRQYKAKIVGRDSKTDLALLKLIDMPSELSGVVLGDSEKLQPGDWVIAIGNPFRLGHTVTVGVVSAKSRRVGGPYDDFIQTDASINPGNSGGPLFNARGEVVGINSAIFSPGRFGATGFNIGIGFATPINLAKEILVQLKGQGKVTRGWLGVMIQTVSQDVAEALKLDETEGALVADVMKDSPAEKAGIERGDVVTRFNGKPVESSDTLPTMVAQTPVGTKVEVELIRDGKRKTLTTEILELKDSEAEEEPADEQEESSHGLSVQELTPDIAKSLGLDGVQGLVVTEVSPDSPADEAGFRRGDVVLEVGGKAVDTRAEFRSSLKKLKPGKPLLLLVRRGDNTIFLTLKVE